MNSPLSCDITEEFERVVIQKKWEGPQRRIGITGGIASGKSEIGRYLQETKKIKIIDADILSHKALASGEITSQKIIARYGEEILKKDYDNKHIINRSILADIIFSNKDERIWLEQLIHPIIRKEIVRKLKQFNNKKIIALVIPLLFEAKMVDLCSEIWVVNCSLKQQYQRLKDRDNLSRSEAKKRIDCQFSMSLKKKFADKVIENSGSKDIWKKQIEDLL
tara:strand:+ start:595 stop:1257 length:663 start_codon:yes stop_codon:yes gene_type:complete